MKGSEYLNNRKSELDSSGRIAEVVSNDEIAIALVYEANSKVSQRISELEKELKVKDTEAEHWKREFLQSNDIVIAKCAEVKRLYTELAAKDARIAELERKGGDLCNVLGNLGIHVHDLGLRPTGTDWHYHNIRAEAAESKLGAVSEVLKETPAYIVHYAPDVDALLARLRSIVEAK